MTAGTVVASCENPEELSQSWTESFVDEVSTCYWLDMLLLLIAAVVSSTIELQSEFWLFSD